MALIHVTGSVGQVLPPARCSLGHRHMAYRSDVQVPLGRDRDQVRKFELRLQIIFRLGRVVVK